MKASSRWTLVTGGSGELGSAICRALAEQKQNVLVHYYNNESKANETVKACLELGSTAAKSVKGDFSSEKSMDNFLAENGCELQSVNQLVNTLGSYLVKNNSELQPCEWYKLFQSNFFTPVHLIHYLAPFMQKGLGGSIVNLGMAGLDYQAVEASVKRGAYRAAKMALLFVTRSLAKELAPKNISVNMVSPGFLENSIDFPLEFPMGRPATFKEVAKLVVFLLSEENRYITGQNIEIAGGTFL